MRHSVATAAAIGTAENQNDPEGAVSCRVGCARGNAGRAGKKLAEPHNSFHSRLEVGEANMAIGVLFELPGVTDAQYDAVSKKLTNGEVLSSLSDWPIGGILSHVAGPTAIRTGPSRAEPAFGCAETAQA
jgi:hypothetical protein